MYGQPQSSHVVGHKCKILKSAKEFSSWCQLDVADHWTPINMACNLGKAYTKNQLSLSSQSQDQAIMSVFCNALSGHADNPCQPRAFIQSQNVFDHMSSSRAQAVLGAQLPGIGLLSTPPLKWLVRSACSAAAAVMAARWGVEYLRAESSKTRCERTLVAARSLASCAPGRGSCS